VGEMREAHASLNEHLACATCSVRHCTVRVSVACASVACVTCTVHQCGVRRCGMCRSSVVMRTPWVIFGSQEHRLAVMR